MSTNWQNKLKYLPILVIILLLLITSLSPWKVVPVGHVGVASFFGKVQEKGYPAGFHFPVNPLYKWEIFDIRQKTHKEQSTIPSRDQLTTELDVSVQYRPIPSMAPSMLSETGLASDVTEVHMVPKLRSLIREQGKTVQRAEDFFLEETQTRLQDALYGKLAEFMSPKGIEVQAVLIREVRLPDFILEAIEQKKQREQEAEKQKAELERYTTEKQQLVAEAKAAAEAAELEAQKVKTIADAKAYEIEQINKAIAENPAYIQLEAIKSLIEISKNPASQIYFLNGDSSQPLPLMHMGETQKKKPAAAAAVPRLRQAQ